MANWTRSITLNKEGDSEVNRGCPKPMGTFQPKKETMAMFCCVHTEQWSADTGYVCDDDQEQEVGALNDGLKKFVAPEIQAIIDKISVNKNLMASIKKSFQQ